MNLGSFWKHFRHLGRVQENCLEALETGRVVFGFGNTTYRGDASRRTLLDYLDRVDQRLKHALTTLTRHDVLIGSALPWMRAHISRAW